MGTEETYRSSDNIGLNVSGKTMRTVLIVLALLGSAVTAGAVWNRVTGTIESHESRLDKMERQNGRLIRTVDRIADKLGVKTHEPE